MVAGLSAEIFVDKPARVSRFMDSRVSGNSFFLDLNSGELI